MGPIGFFVVTSTGNALATGLVMGIGLDLIYALLRDWGNWERLKWWLFWPIKRSFTDKEVRGVGVGYGILFMVMSWLLV